jgi:hypothetical protein
VGNLAARKSTWALSANLALLWSYLPYFPPLSQLLLHHHLKGYRNCKERVMDRIPDVEQIKSPADVPEKWIQSVDDNVLAGESHTSVKQHTVGYLVHL